MNWQYIDPETRDLSTPELWDAWRDEVAEFQHAECFSSDGDTICIGDVTGKYVQVLYYSDGKCIEDCHVSRPDPPSLESRLTDALARIEKLEAACDWPIGKGT